MDSELTLVTPPPPTAYFLSATDLKNTVVYAQPAMPLYRITSDARQIRICDATVPGRTIAVVHRRDLLSDTISFPLRRGDGNKNGTGAISHLRIQRWLRRSKMIDQTLAFTFDTEFGPYVWKVVSRCQSKVFADYDLETPVAKCYCHKSHPTDKPVFVLRSAGEPIRDDIVVAYFVQRYRMILESRTIDLFVGPN